MIDKIQEIPGVELKVCPFCGSEAAMYKYNSDVCGEQFYVECMNEECEVRPSTLLMDTQTQASYAWNVRPVEDNDEDPFEDQFLLEEELDLDALLEQVDQIRAIQKKMDDCDVLTVDGLEKFLALLREKNSLTN